MLEVRHPEGEAAHRHETSEVDLWKILAVGAGLILLIGVISLLVAWMYSYLGHTDPGVSANSAPLANVRRLPPPPRLQPSPKLDLQRMRQEEERVLNSYGWVDQQAGVVRIPIDRAIDLVVQRGLPVQPAAPQKPPAGVQKQAAAQKPPAAADAQEGQSRRK